MELVNRITVFPSNWRCIILSHCKVIVRFLSFCSRIFVVFIDSNLNNNQLKHFQNQDSATLSGTIMIRLSKIFRPFNAPPRNKLPKLLKNPNETASKGYKVWVICIILKCSALTDDFYFAVAMSVRIYTPKLSWLLQYSTDGPPNHWKTHQIIGSQNDQYRSS